jgi:RNA polymerase sigma-B factor
VRPADDSDAIERFRVLRKTDDPAIRDELIARFRGMGQACARRFHGRGEPLDDLEQVAMIGLVKAVDRFDPEQGFAFASFAVPTIMGELRRHFRDTGWSMRVNRRTKDLHLRLSGAVEDLSQQLGRAPRPAEVAEHLDVTEEDVLEAMDVGGAYRPLSLDAPSPGSTDHGPADRLGEMDAGALTSEQRIVLGELFDSLDPREQRIIFLRFYEELSQSEIAAQVGTSQVHVSRLIRASLERMRVAAGHELT